MCNFLVLPLNRRGRPPAFPWSLPRSQNFLWWRAILDCVHHSDNLVGATSWQESGPLMPLQTGPASQTQTFKWKKESLSFFLNPWSRVGGGCVSWPFYPKPCKPTWWSMWFLESSFLLFTLVQKREGNILGQRASEVLRWLAFILNLSLSASSQGGKLKAWWMRCLCHLAGLVYTPLVRKDCTWDRTCKE